MSAELPDLPSGPIETEPLNYRPRAEQEAILRDTLHAAGVELGAYDERIVRWFAQFADGGTFTVIASWIARAGESP